MIVGLDEVGRGCWAGPLVAAAVGFDDTVQIEGLADSKKLSAKRRVQLVAAIQAATQHIGIGWVWPREINRLGLTESVRLAMQRAYQELDTVPARVIIDGNYNYLPELPQAQAIIKADGTIPSVSAASIIAKVARDTYMITIATKYPSYGFEKHVGYGTELHRAALAAHGISPIHRTTYKPVAQYL